MIYKRGNFTANPSQSAAITHPPAPLMIIAGAGTGKTTTLLHRICYLIEKYKIPPKNILTITYTERAADELKTRIVSIIGDSAKAITTSTFHAFCYNVVKQHQISGNSIPTLMEDGDIVYLFMQNFDKLGPFESRLFVTEPIKSITKSFIPFINRLRDELIDPTIKNNPPIKDSIDEESIAQLNDLKKIYPLYQKWKNEQNLVDYGDMILKCHELLKSDKSVLKQIKDQYKYIIIDEFQDNNYALNEVVNTIVGDSGQLTVVGDEDQVVYSFRGASKYNIASFRDKYKNYNNYQEISLEENFRSTQQILDVANDSISNSKEGLRKNLKALNGKIGQKPQLIRSENKYHPKLIADEIKSLSEQFNYNDMAVLCRTKAQVRAIADELNRHNITTRTYLIDYFKIPEIKDLLAWCNIVAETDDQDASLFRLISRKIDKNIANELFSNFSKRDHSPRIDQIKNVSNTNVSNLIHVIFELRGKSQKKTASEMVWEICERAEIFKPLISRYEYIDQLAILNIGQFIKKSNSFTTRHKEDNSLYTFSKYMKVLQEFEGIQTIYPSEYHMSHSVLVNTIHGVKGGEFPIVFIPFNRVQSFPLNYKKSAFIDFPPTEWLSYNNDVTLTPKELHLEEERRLFYVGITRAKESLYIYAPNKYTSRFIKELDNDLLKVTDMDNILENTKINTYSDLRVKYEKRLSNALNMNQFNKSTDIIKAIERIDHIAKGVDINWSNTDWENELKTYLSPSIKTKMPEKLNLSASSIETYEQCPLKYRLSNIDKIPQIGSKPQLTFGNIIHKVLEQFHQPNSEQSQERLLNLLKSNWESLGFDYQTQEEDFKRQGEELLLKYIDHLQDNPANVVEREFKFSFELDNIIINGKIDRIDKIQNGYNVIDYKTSKTPTDAKKSVQLAIYSMYLHQAKDEIFKGIPRSAILYFLREDEPIREHSFSFEELENMKEKLIETGKNIRDQNFSPCKGFHCEWCDYKNILCPEWEEK